MKKSLIVPIILAVFSHAHSISLGEILGMRRRWHEASYRTAAEPEVVEIVRWRQPVCVVPGRDVPPCLATLQKLQNDYQRNSAGGIEDDNNEEIPKKIGKNRPGVLTAEVVDSIELENVASVKIDSSEGSGQGLGHEVTLNLRSKTPEIESSADGRRRRYLAMSTFGKATTVVHDSPPAIYVTKVMNSPVTATLVAKNCFPDMGVPMCESYQETITIYRDPGSSQPGESEGTTEDNDRADQTSGTNGETAKESNDSPDFWTDPSNPNFDDGTSHGGPQRPPGLLGQAIQHVIGKPGVISVIPTGIIDAIANKPGILGGLPETDKSGESPSIANAATTLVGTVVKPQVVEGADERQRVEATSSTPRPGLIGSFLDIHRPTILDNLLTSGLGIFNRSTTPKPEVSANGGGASSSADSQYSGGLLGQGAGQGQVIQAIQDFVHRPDKVSAKDKPEFMPVLVVEPTRRPGLLQALWGPGSLGIFSTASASSTGKPGGADQKLLHDDGTESVHADSSEAPARPQVGENLGKTEDDGGNEDDEGKPTAAPGLFGGLFKNPTRPNGLQETGVDNTKTILGIGSSIFSRPKNKPLIIERPGAKPLLVEKPIYVQEKPVQSAGLLNFFIPASDKPILSVDHEVIKEPVYVYQKPQTSSGILGSVFGENLSVPGFFQGWAIFGNGGEKKVEQNQSIGEAVEISPAGENLRSAIDGARRENPESIATKSTPMELDDPSLKSERSEGTIDEEAIEEIVEALEEEGLEEAPKSYVDVNEPEFGVIKIVVPEETTVDAAKVENQETPDGPSKSANTLEEIPQDIASEVNAELAGPIEIVETALKATTEKPAVEKSSVDISKSLASDGALEKLEDATAVEEIVEKPSVDLSKSLLSDAALEKLEDATAVEEIVEKPSVDLSKSLPSDAALEKLEDATAVEEIVEKSSTDLSKSLPSDNSLEKLEDATVVEEIVEKSSTGLSKSLPSDNSLEKLEDATAVEEIVEKPERNLLPESEDVVKEETEDSDDESAIEKDA